jgi:uncharacterized protein
MSEVKMKLDERKRGKFYIEEDGKEWGEMVIGISETTLTVYHTEVNPAMEGKGLAKQMLEAMAAYAREHGLTVLPLCEYVHTHFRRHPDDYADIWTKQNR